MEQKEFYISDDGIKLHAKLDFPDGKSDKDKLPLMLLFHGFTGHMDEAHLCVARDAALSEGIAVLRIDSYGHGKSDGAFEDHTLYKWITGGLKAIEYAKSLEFVTDMYICGHSQGGLLVVLLAGMCPDTFKALIPMAPALMIPDGARKGELIGISFDPNAIPDVLVGFNGLRLKGDYVRVAQTIHVEDEIDRFKGPVCIIHGDADEAVPYECGKEAAGRYKNCVLETIKGATHCYEGHFEEVSFALRNFLRTLLND